LDSLFVGREVKMKRILLPILVIGVLLSGACGTPSIPVSEPEIPSHYTTFTDVEGLFNISYPPDWELALSLIPDIEASAKDIITSIESDLPVENARVIFLAGLPIEVEYLPNVNIVVESMPGVVWTHDKVLEAEITGIKQVIQDYRQFSRVKTTVDGREATILGWEGTYPQLGKGCVLQMFVLVGKTVWCVTCTPPSEEFSKWEEDFQAIVRSLRILK
jgi:hypothetical protein